MKTPNPTGYKSQTTERELEERFKLFGPWDCDTERPSHWSFEESLRTRPKYDKVEAALRALARFAESSSTSR